MAAFVNRRHMDRGEHVPTIVSPAPLLVCRRNTQPGWPIILAGRHKGVRGVRIPPSPPLTPAPSVSFFAQTLIYTRVEARMAPRVRMATLGKRSTRSRLRRTIAVFGVALILVAQIVATVHWHPPTQSATAVASAQPSIDAGLCALCQLAFHSSFNPSSAPFIEPHEIGSALASTDFRLGFASCDSGSALTRAPPAAA